MLLIFGICGSECISVIFFFNSDFLNQPQKLIEENLSSDIFFEDFLDVYLQTPHNLRIAKPQMHLGNYPFQLFRRRRCLFVLKIIPSISAKILRRPLNSRHRSAEFFPFYDDNFASGHKIALQLFRGSAIGEQWHIIPYSSAEVESFHRHKRTIMKCNS